MVLSATTRRRICARLREESGFQLIELLIVASLLVVVLGAVLALVDVTGQTAPRQVERGERIREGETAVDRMIRDIRAAKSVTVASAGRIDLVEQVRTGSASTAYRSVRLDCSAAQSCVRTEGPEGGTLAQPETLLTGVSNSDVFSATPATGTAQYVGISLALSLSGGSKPYEVTDGTELRNGS